jgi:hypothetical protein
VNPNNARHCSHSKIRGKLHGEGKCEPCLSIDLCHQPKYHRVTKASLKVPFVSPFDKQQDLYERIDRLAEQDPSHYSKDPNEREKYSAAHQKALCEQFSKALNETGQKVLDNLVKHDKKGQNIPCEQMWLFELQLKDFWLERAITDSGDEELLWERSQKRMEARVRRWAEKHQRTPPIWTTEVVTEVPNTGTTSSATPATTIPQTQQPQPEPNPVSPSSNTSKVSQALALV